MLERTVEFLLMNLRDWMWLLLLLCSGGFLYRICAAFLPLKPCLRWNILLYLCLSVVTGMGIWVGDNNLLFTLPP
ncbi:MAG: hypothetical protein K2O18_12280, partial [Oscillospiraceae bacterium]|nr:hypothetical protein [Oscillospiraceae bacterium]